MTGELEPAVDPVVTVVVVAWRSAATIDACLRSVLEPTDGPACTVLVVDNDADPGTRARLRAWGGRITVLRLPRNAGFAGGVAAAVARATTAWVLLLNDDAELLPGAVAALLRRAAVPGGLPVGAVQAAVRLQGSDPPLTNSTGNEVTPDGFGYDRDWLRPWPAGRTAEDDPFGFCGAAALLSRDAVLRAGGMDPSLFLYYEDTDLSWRLRLAGYRVVLCPEAVVDHRHGTSSGEGSELFRLHNHRNRLLVLARNATPGLALSQWLRFPLTALSLALRPGTGEAWDPVRWRALGQALRRLPRTLRRRRRDRPAVPRAAVQRLFVRPDHDLGAYRS